MLAAMCNERNSIGVEIDNNFEEVVTRQFGDIVNFSNEIVSGRLKAHLGFVEKRIDSGKEVKYKNKHYGFPVVTRQETGLRLQIYWTVFRTAAIEII